MRHDQNIRKQDRRIEAEAPDRLQRHFGGKLRIEAEIEEIAGLFAHRPVFRQIPPGLPHQPDRRRPRSPMIEHVEERLVHRGIQSRSSFLKSNLRILIVVIIRALIGLIHFHPHRSSSRRTQLSGPADIDVHRVGASVESAIYLAFRVAIWTCIVHALYPHVTIIRRPRRSIMSPLARDVDDLRAGTGQATLRRRPSHGLLPTESTGYPVQRPSCRSAPAAISICISSRTRPARR